MPETIIEESRTIYEVINSLPAAHPDMESFFLSVESTDPEKPPLSGDAPLENPGWTQLICNRVLLTDTGCNPEGDQLQDPYTIGSWEITVTEGENVTKYQGSMNE